jgi:hypothetical protein
MDEPRFCVHGFAPVFWMAKAGSFHLIRPRLRDFGSTAKPVIFNRKIEVLTIVQNSKIPKVFAEPNRYTPTRRMFTASNRSADFQSANRAPPQRGAAKLSRAKS